MLRIPLNLRSSAVLDGNQHPARIRAIVRTRGMDNLFHDSFDYTVHSPVRGQTKTVQSPDSPSLDDVVSLKGYTHEHAKVLYRLCGAVGPRYGSTTATTEYPNTT